EAGRVEHKGSQCGFTQQFEKPRGGREKSGAVTAPSPLPDVLVMAPGGRRDHPCNGRFEPKAVVRWSRGSRHFDRTADATNYSAGRMTIRRVTVRRGSTSDR